MSFLSRLSVAVSLRQGRRSFVAVALSFRRYRPAAAMSGFTAAKLIEK